MKTFLWISLFLVMRSFLIKWIMARHERKLGPIPLDMKKRYRDIYADFFYGCVTLIMLLIIFSSK